MRSYQHPITHCHSSFHIKLFYNRACNPPSPLCCMTLARSQPERGDASSPAETNPREHQGKGRGGRGLRACLLNSWRLRPATCSGGIFAWQTRDDVVRGSMFSSMLDITSPLGCSTPKKEDEKRMWLAEGKERAWSSFEAVFSCKKPAVNGDILGKRN